MHTCFRIIDQKDDPNKAPNTGQCDVHDKEHLRCNFEKLTLCDNSQESYGDKNEKSFWDNTEESHEESHDYNTQIHLGNVIKEYINDTKNGKHKFIRLNDSVIAMKTFPMHNKQTKVMDPNKHYASYVLIKSQKVKGEENLHCSCLTVRSRFDTFKLDKKRSHCIHLTVARNILPGYGNLIPDATSNPENDTFLIFTGNRKLWLSVKWGKSTDPTVFAILKRTERNNIVCNVCYPPTDCKHATKVYSCPELKPPAQPCKTAQSNPMVNMEEEMRLHQVKGVSRRKIHLPYSTTEKIRMDQLRRDGYSKMRNLVPPYDPNEKCSHMIEFSQDDPIEKGWIMNDDANLVIRGFTYSVTVYYRKTDRCTKGCKQEYDGREDFILNLDNKWLFSHTLLLELPVTQVQNKDNIFSSVKASAGLDKLCGIRMNRNDSKRQLEAYNCFIRLLDSETWSFGFTCPDCEKADRKILLVDGVQIGASKLVIYYLDLLAF